MLVEQSITICDLSNFVYTGRCINELIQQNERPDVKIHYIREIPRRSGGDVIYLCDRDTYDLLFNRKEPGYVVMVATDPYKAYRDVPNRNLYDIIYVNNATSDELVKFRLNRIIDRVHHEYVADVTTTALQTVLDSSPDMMWIKDRSGRHVALNNAFCAVVGKTKDFCLNKEHPDIWGITWDEYRSTDFACRKSEEKVIATGKTGVFEENVLSDGKLKKFMTYKTPIYDKYHNLIGTSGVGYDITDLQNLGSEA